MAGEGRVDRLLADSEKLREDLLRMAARLTAFSEQLTAEAQALRAEAGKMTQQPDADRIARLTDLAQTLIDEVQELASGSGEQIVTLTKRSRANRRMIWVVTASVALDILLTLAMGFALFQVDSNADRIDSLTQRLDVAQTETRQRAFCPLYEIFLSSKSAKGRAAADDPEVYDRSFEVIEDGYQALRCPEFADDETPFGKKG